MYLKRLFSHNKWWFAVVAGFAFLQVLINLERGMVVSPWYHYGMYSQRMEPQESYSVLQVTVDGEVLRPADFRPQQWDKIMQPLVYFSKHHNWNKELFTEIHRITSLRNPGRYHNELPKRDFYKWYQGYLGLILEKDITELTVDQIQYAPGK